MNDALDRLREEYARPYDKRPTTIVGAGISVAASINPAEALWDGLLRAGVERCREVDPDMTPEDARRWFEHLHDANVDTLLAVAAYVEARLRRKPDAFSQWLRDTVGALALNPVQRPLMLAINALSERLYTTNYDNLLEAGTGRHAATVGDGAARRDPKDYVLHVHGHFAKADSVVFGPAAYERAVNDEIIRTLLRSDAIRNGMLYVGVGGGIADPNFQAFRRWIRDNVKDAETYDFRLVVGHELGFRPQVCVIQR